MAVKYFSQDSSYSQPQKRIISAWIKQVVVSEGKQLGDINYIFCSDQYLLNINREYLKHDYYTDVITFDYSSEGLISGDIFISVDTVRENASIFSITFSGEMQRVIIHGILHLCGYGDKTEVENRHMHFLEDKYLDLLKNK